MSPFAEFVRTLLREGRAVFREPPVPLAKHGPKAAEILAAAFADYRLALAGPLIDFDDRTALAAASLVHHACWFLVSRADPGRELRGRLALPGPPRSPAEHLSADLTLRFLPQIHRRALAHDPADPLVALVADILRRWPLSGVLSSVEDPPLTPTDFGGHHGLLLLYAERWCRNEKPAWLPEGPGMEHLELVWTELGKDVSILQSMAETTRGNAHD